MTEARRLQKLIHVGCRELGIDRDTRQDLQLVACGKSSMSDMNAADLGKVVDALKARGFAPSKGGKRPQASRADVRFCHVLWRLLVKAGEAREPGATGLNKFIRSQFENTWGHVPIDIDTMTDWKEIDQIVQALKAWCGRAGVELEK